MLTRYTHKVSKNRAKFYTLAILLMLTVGYLRFSLQYSFLLETLSSKSLEKEPLIFVGGHPRSGTTLMRAMLDAHPSVRCGVETAIIPTLLSIFDYLIQIKEYLWIRDSAIGNVLPDGEFEISDDSSKNFTSNYLVLARLIRVVIQYNGREASRFCNKVPGNAYFIEYLKSMFPQMKFILMIRDVRGVFNSYVNRLGRSNLSDFENSVRSWNQQMEIYTKQCKNVGPNHCLIVSYENLVLNPKPTLQKILKFLDLRWSDSILEHQKFIGDRIEVDENEWSASQVKQPLYTDSINSWNGKIPQEMLDKLDSLAPMLRRLGYDPKANNSYNTLLV